MRRIILIIGALIILSITAMGLYILRPSEEPSSPIQVTPITTQVLATPQEITTTESVPTEETVPEKTGLSGTFVYQISQPESQVRFSLDETLRGKPFRPVGASDQVAGEIRLDFDHKQATVGTIQVNARTLKTDSTFRDRAIQNQILDTATFEFITFTPTLIAGLPEETAIGEPVQFQITGDLTIRDVTQQVTFDMTATLVSENRLQGYGKATVLRSDYGLTIPSVQSVANVSDEVLLEIQFVALAI